MRTCPVSSFLLRYGMVLSVSGSGYETSTGTFFQIHSLASRLDALHLLRRQHAGKVDRHEVRAHVEAHVLIAEAAVDDAGEDMLAGSAAA